MKRRISHLVTAILLAAILFGQGDVSWGAGEVPWKNVLRDKDPPHVQELQTENLLVNGSMEEGFYWKYPNHYVANNWQRWWVGGSIPEYDDVRAWRSERYDGNHAQIYFRWGKSYTAGVYQRVAVRPCTYYQFSMYGRNHSGYEVDHHARIGIDPLGREYDLYMPSLPPDIFWSLEQTFFYTWGLHTVTGESHSDYITAIAYVSPDNVYTTYDTFWDAGTLIELPPTPGRLPKPLDWEPSEFITEVVSYTQSGSLVIEWGTAEPASSQVWYHVHTPAPPITPTGTLLFPAAYLPLIINSQTPQFDMYTHVDRSDLTHHQATIWDLEEGQTVEFVILARHLVGDECRTSSSPLFEVMLPASGTVDPP
ncbi:MAG: hypothetical protein SXV54_01640 [Chloroflexota bacterium]|nr:hypothetical protein [Chloroflexota bacterium]